ncbi:arylamine N-acetyltransferase family protein [Streptantibioticus ferralitis]|uniref:Arylamine N-acetyltransferase n=1 Tax=Streptantibioticus ferralitis TaxID=236510 RepID=A0ABT5ZA98_9ACTN|nr:arylamine N-acetyltransferase [Streptantibioticus ferralitis]MDF2260694.1 arylamine N-acetyltransferase [Streptantibioticus ferralitis]
MTMDAAMVDEYLGRIGATRPRRADLDALRELQERHVLSVPFENLDYHLDEDIFLDERVVQKIVRDRRGGGCYELNPSFGFLLTALGYQVGILGAQVRRPDGLGSPLGHLVLRVDLEEPWLVDVGFRKNSRLPLRIASPDVQPDPHGDYRLTRTENGAIDVSADGAPLYRVDDRPVRLQDFRPTLWWFRTCPDSPFLQDLFCSLPTTDGRVTLKGDRLTRTSGGERSTEVLPDDDAIRAAYRKFFGFELDTLPTAPVVAPGSSGVQLD